MDYLDYIALSINIKSHKKSKAKSDYNTTLTSGIDLSLWFYCWKWEVICQIFYLLNSDIYVLSSTGRYGSSGDDISFFILNARIFTEH